MKSEYPEATRNAKGGMEGVEVVCRPCQGEGYIYRIQDDYPRECGPCKGTGKVKVRASL